MIPLLFHYLLCTFSDVSSSRVMSWYNVSMIFHLVVFQRLNFVDVATGSLGQGLSCAAGMAYTGKYVDKAG